MSLSDKLRQAKDNKADANAAAGEAFLKANAVKPGIVELPGGIQYEVLKEGSGARPGPTSEVTCHYHGTLIDGTVFDSSVQRGAPASFPLNRVIKGWTEALQLMSIGSKWRLFLPPAMAYGDRQVGPTIGPNSTLIFEVELLGIK
jgi:FKBP-type peptidyl-prolyl cis-trans isomerase FklB